ncbi:MAG: hypothetical protein ACI9DF_004431 [Verrucomicrobiales bacterium]
MTAYQRSGDGWAEVGLRNGRMVSVPQEDLATTRQFNQEAARATKARRSAFQRPAVERRSGLASPGPPPADFIPPPLPDAAAGAALLEQGTSDLLSEKNE